MFCAGLTHTLAGSKNYFRAESGIPHQLRGLRERCKLPAPRPPEELLELRMASLDTIMQYDCKFATQEQEQEQKSSGTRRHRCDMLFQESIGSEMVPLDRALLSSYRLSMVNNSAICNVLAAICNANFDWGSDSQNLPFPWKTRPV